MIPERRGWKDLPKGPRDKEQMNVVVTTALLSGKGGVSQYMRSVLGRVKEKHGIRVDILEIGWRQKICRALSAVQDQVKIYKRLAHGRVDVVHINPSLDPKSLVRDGLFAIQSRWQGAKVLVFFHGWTEKCERLVDSYLRYLFRWTVGSGDRYVVLNRRYKGILLEWGVKAPIHVETTAVEDALLKGMDIRRKVSLSRGPREWTILFLGRLIKEKGIYEAIDACCILMQTGVPLRLIVAGDGPELEKARRYGTEKMGANVEFEGFVAGEKKKELLYRSDIYLFPSYHGEGMPISVLEAFAFGLAVVARPVGGLADVFQEGKMGFITESQEPRGFAALLERLVSDPPLCRRMGKYNHEYALEHFMASRVAERLSTIYRDICKTMTGDRADTPWPM